MRKSLLFGIVAIFLATGAMLGAAEYVKGVKGAKGAGSSPSYETANLKRGGLLYDKWFKVTGAEPQGTHPAYPAGGKKSGADTWRCKECHGWDYLGKDGRYREGSHFTGIPGVLGARPRKPEDLFGALSEGSHYHDYSPYLSESDRWALVAFLREGIFDASGVFPVDGTVSGNAGNGQPFYAARCASCHGSDGNRIDFKPDEEGIQGIGWLARKNSQETLHKIRWGHPGSDMPSMVEAGLSLSETVNLLVHCRELD